MAAPKHPPHIEKALKSIQHAHSIINERTQPIVGAIDATNKRLTDGYKKASGDAHVNVYTTKHLLNNERVDAFIRDVHAAIQQQAAQSYTGKKDVKFSKDDAEHADIAEKLGTAFYGFTPEKLREHYATHIQGLEKAGKLHRFDGTTFVAYLKQQKEMDEVENGIVRKATAHLTNEHINDVVSTIVDDPKKIKTNLIGDIREVAGLLRAYHGNNYEKLNNQIFLANESLAQYHADFDKVIKAQKDEMASVAKFYKAPKAAPKKK